MLSRAALAVVLFLPASITAAVAADPEWSPQRHAVITLAEGVSLTFDVSPFRAAKHKIGWCSRQGQEYVCSIDGHPYFGSDGQQPYAQLDSAVFRYGDHSVHLDVSCMFNPWNVDPDGRSYKARKTEGGYIVSAEFSDGAGGYAAQWLVIGGGSVRTSLDSGEEDEPASAE